MACKRTDETGKLMCTLAVPHSAARSMSFFNGSAPAREQRRGVQGDHGAYLVAGRVPHGRNADFQFIHAGFVQQANERQLLFGAKGHAGGLLSRRAAWYR